MIFDDDDDGEINDKNKVEFISSIDIESKEDNIMSNNKDKNKRYKIIIIIL